MRKWLKTLPNQQVISIAHDMGYEKQDVAEAINYLVEYAKSYSLRVDDFKARYQRILLTMF